MEPVEHKQQTLSPWIWVLVGGVLLFIGFLIVSEQRASRLQQEEQFQKQQRLEQQRLRQENPFMPWNRRHRD